jgi:hypothetical protein
MILPDVLTFEQAYAPAMEIREEEGAAAYFQALVERDIRMNGHSVEEAEAIERHNLGYYAGYYDQETRDRVLQLFNAPHPYFGREPVSTEGAYALGLELGRSMRPPGPRSSEG